MNDDVFGDIMDDSVGTGMIDPITGDSYNPIEDFDQVLKDSNDVRTVDTSEEEGYKEIPTNILDDEDKSDEPTPFSSDLIEQALRSKGINPNSIKVENEDGEIEEVKFNDLSDEEKLELLNYEASADSFDFSDHEIEAVEFLRENNLTLNELAQAIRQKTIDELNNQPQTYTVDDFTDDELFIVNYKNEYGDDFTDEELLHALEMAKENEGLFNKQMAKVRNNFKEYEQQAAEQERIQKTEAERAQEEQYISQVVNVARQLNDMHETVDLTDDDKEEILAFMFDKNPAGETSFDKALKDPKTRYQAAWYIKHGDEVFQEIHKYYQGELSKLNRQIKQQSIPPKPKPEAFIKENKKQHTTQRPRKLEDLF